MTKINETNAETVNVKTAKASKVPGPRYPFKTKAQIQAQLQSDPLFVVECLQIMQARQTSFEQETNSTVVKNRAGWMSSHAVNGGKLAKKFAEEGLTQEELDQAYHMVRRYTRQLAEHFRQSAIEADPSLQEVARIFSAG